ncbi:MAG: hypothetical protein ACREH3_04930, partial [Geminicoccales bacterium]
MPLTDDVRTKLVRDRAMLTRRFGNTADETEKRRIQNAIGKINLEIRKLDLADLLGAAQVIADSIDILEQVVKSVRTGPFDGFLGDIEMAIRQAHELSRRAHGLEKLPPAIDPAGTPVAETPKAPAPTLEPPVNSRQFAE